MQNEELTQQIKSTIRDVPDFPKKGILFKDIMPILENPALTREITMAFVKAAQDLNLDAVMGIESRGFFWGLLIAQELNIPFIPIRKKGKLPYKTISHEYDLEYGSAVIEVHEDAIKPNSRVLIHDDLLATGGTAAAAALLVEKQQAVVAGFSFLVILEFLKGKEKINAFSEQIYGIVTY
ncbi:MAG: adenine phosphoribosyltransferase [Vicingaceae bacterium]